jgi:hypothetical protein
MTYVLIVMTMAHYGWNSTSIPNYRSMEACKQAGEVWREEVFQFYKDYYNPSFYKKAIRYVCLPGPN